ncbi:MAG: DUF262 domain-containing protein, partial [Acidobacteriaceae bacterium]|nr:DUF262 domain-containing protein [Acidobacteriaceae bacterium]
VINFFSGFKQNLVPLFQRPYTWADKQWQTLWEDILSFYDCEDNDLKSTHFMGAIVTMPARRVPVGVSKFLVIDGQQRLMFRFSWKWRRRSPSKVKERTHAEATEALYTGRESRHSEAASIGAGSDLRIM